MNLFVVSLRWGFLNVLLLLIMLFCVMWGVRDGCVCVILVVFVFLLDCLNLLLLKFFLFFCIFCMIFLIFFWSFMVLGCVCVFIGRKRFDFVFIWFRLKFDCLDFLVGVDLVYNFWIFFDLELIFSGIDFNNVFVYFVLFVLVLKWIFVFNFNLFLLNLSLLFVYGFWNIVFKFVW